VVCQCSGSVQLDFTGLLRPYQRLSDDVDAQIQRWGKMGHSLRDMQTELRHGHLGPLGLRTLCEHTGWRFSSGWYPYRNDLSGNGSVARSAVVASPATRD
jgi:hypothetical protein